MTSVRPHPTLLELAGATIEPPSLSEAVLVLIDYQNEYLDGPLALPKFETVVARASTLLIAARRSGADIIHVAHRGAPGSMFDREAHRGTIISQLAPMPGETVIEKARPNAFHGTDLAARVTASDRRLVVGGLMTHMCVASTCRAALDLSLPVTLVHDACATRPLPRVDGSVIAAEDLHAAEIAALADRFVGLITVADLA
jgi:nicotinamidase-related amidase